MKEIIVFGVTGGTGRLVVKQALEAGHQVTGVVRKPDAFTLKHQQLKIIQGDVLQPNSFKNAIRGQDVVISCIGTQKKGPTTIYSEGVGNIIKAMQKENINRMIYISAGAVITPPKSSFIMKFVTKIFCNKYLNIPMLTCSR